MTPLRVVLLVSAGINLAAAIALGVRARPGEVAASASSPSIDAPLLHETVETPSRSWSDLVGLDDTAFATALMQQGWSDDVLRAIIDARLDIRFGPQSEAVLTAHRSPYWRGDRRGNIHPDMDAAVRAELRRISAERNDARRAMLGPRSQDPRSSVYRERRYGPIAAEKIEALEAIESDYRDLINDARRRAEGMMLEEDREVIRLLEQERDADIAALLTPEERDAYDLRMSRTALSLRYRLQDFAPTEEEFIAIFRLRKAFDEQYGGSTPAREQRQQRYEAEAELNRQIAVAIGEERFAEYDLKAHPAWQRTADWVRREQLPEAATEPLAKLGRDMQDRLQALSRNQALSASERTAQLTALRNEAQLRLGQILPAEHHSRYESGPGSWLKALQPRQR